VTGRPALVREGVVMFKQLVGIGALIAGLAVAAVAAPQEVERVLRIYDVSLLVEPIEDNPGPVLTLDNLTGMDDGGGLAFSTEQADFPSHFDPEELVEIIFNSVDPDSWGHADTRCQVTGTTLEVVQTTAVHDKIAQLLGALRSELGQQLEVEVQFWRISATSAQRVLAGTPGRTGLLPAAQVPQLIAGAGVAAGTAPQSLYVQLRSGQRSHAAALRERLVLSDYEVEVAEKVASPDPIVSKQRFGAVADVTALAARDGSKLTLECRLALAVPGDLTRKIETDLGVIELPERFVYDCYSTATPAFGQAWLGAASRPGGDAVLFVVIPRSRSLATGAGHKALPKAAGKRMTLAYDLGALTYYAPDFPGPALRLQSADSGAAGGIPGLGMDEEGDSTVRLTEDEVAELIRANLDPDSWEHPRNVLEVRAGAIVVTHTPAMHAQVRAYIAKLLASRVAELRCEALVVAADAALLKLIAARTGPAIPQAALAPWLAALADPAAVAGYASFSVQNRQRSCATAVRCLRILRDWDTEVAAEAKIGDPIVGVVYEGFVGDLQPTLAGDGKAVALRLAPVLTQFAGEPRRIATKHGDAQLVDIHRLGTPGTVVLPLGDWGVIRLGRDAAGRELVQLFSARLVR
jgi:hypothetical protein